MAYILYLLLVFLPLACGATPSVPSEAQAKKVFEQSLVQDLKLHTFQKTDGMWQGNFYAVEFDATVVALTNYLYGSACDHSKGEIVYLTGNVFFSKAESGWRAMHIGCYRKKGNIFPCGCSMKHN